MITVKGTSFQEILANTKRDNAVYEKLNPKEKAEVDAHNARVAACGGNIQAIIDLGKHPFPKYREKYKEV